MNISYPNIQIWTLTSTLYLAKYIHVQKNFFKLVSNSVNLCELNICFVHCFCYFSHVHILSLVCTCISIPSLLGALIKKLWTLNFELWGYRRYILSMVWTSYLSRSQALPVEIREWAVRTHGPGLLVAVSLHWYLPHRPRLRCRQDSRYFLQSHGRRNLWWKGQETNPVLH